MSVERSRNSSRPNLLADPAWERLLHEAVGHPWPCPELEAFQERWFRLERMFAGVLPLGAGHDADQALARALWCLVRHTKPQRVVETGVARGVLTSFILQALQENDEGHLWSIDLPPMLPRWSEESGAAVTEELRARWSLLRGASRRHLPGLLHDLGSIDLFVHDSLHTTRTMEFELSRAWKALAPGGVLVADDADLNDAFASFADGAVSRRLVVQEELKPAKFGIAFKHDDD
jgi:predicted O-methyltransferase YrrM